MKNVSKTVLSVGVAGVVVSLFAVGNALFPDLGKAQPAAVMFPAMSRQQTPTDRAVVNRLPQDAGVDMSNARLLGETEGAVLLLTRDPDQGWCIVVSRGDIVGAGCTPDKAIERTGTVWTEYTDGDGSYLAAAVPEGYSSSEVETNSEIVMESEDVVVVETANFGEGDLVLESLRYADIDVRDAQ